MQARIERGVFIAIEGIDGAGNTTNSTLLAQWLEEKGYKVLLTKEPTKSDIGLLIRKFLKDKRLPPAVDALLYAADRTLHLEVEVKPALEKGFIVVSDRYLESSIAYQTAQGLDVKWIEEINRFAVKPDLTFILDVDPEVACKRKRGFGKEKFEKKEFLKRVRELFLKRAREKGYFVVDASKPVNEVQEEIRRKVEEYLRAKMSSL